MARNASTSSWSSMQQFGKARLLPITSIDLASAAPFQVARGSQVTDADGTRQATLLFPQGTAAEILLPDGSTQPVNSLNVLLIDQ